MSLFIVRHEHDPAHCPAGDPLVGATMLNHLTARGHGGVAIKAEAVVDGAHALYMIVESPDEARLREFLQPFSMAGSVEVYPASTCAKVVASGGCTMAAPSLDGSVPAFDPETACRDAIDAGLVVHRAHPLNCETPIPALIGGVVMPNARFYVRNHFQIPVLDATRWRLRIGGEVERPLALSLRDLQQMQTETLVVTLECAGNGRSLLDRPAEGEPWGLGAVSTAEWTGVPLEEVLDRAGVKPSAREVLFRGADRGTVNGRSGTIAFERSLSVDVARDSEALVAYAMNGEPLPLEHGYPARLIVPGWYAVASVKWLTDIEVLDAPFTGYYQTDRYIYDRERDGEVVRDPVSLQQVRALITEPGDGCVIGGGEVVVRGTAWSGAAPIAKVEVSVNDGPWQPARLVGDRRRHGWQWWELMTWLRAPSATIRARATDLAGRRQPDESEWTPLGYGANGVQEVRVSVT